MTTSRLRWSAAVACAFGVCAALSTPAIADGGGYRNGGYANGGNGNGDETYSTVIVSGADMTQRANEMYTGFYYALNRDLDKDGFLIRILGSRGYYDYDTPGFFGPIQIDSNYWQGDVMIGYQVVRGGIDIGAYIGVDYQDYDLSFPGDSTNPLRGSEVGFKTAFDLESNCSNNSPWYVALRGSYSTAFDSYYALGRIGHKVGRFTVGPEAWALGDVSGDAQRLGAFIAWDVAIGRGTTGNISFSVGHQFSDGDDGGFEGGGRNFDDGTYGTVKFWLAFN